MSELEENIGKKVCVLYCSKTLKASELLPEWREVAWLGNMCVAFSARSLMKLLMRCEPHVQDIMRANM